MMLKYAKMKSLTFNNKRELPRCAVDYTGINLVFVKT